MYVVESEIARPFREWAGGKFIETDSYGWQIGVGWSRPKLKYLFSCRMCTGFWVGLIVGAATGVNPLVVAALSHWLFIMQRIAERLAK